MKLVKVPWSKLKWAAKILSKISLLPFHRLLALGPFFLLCEIRHTIVTLNGMLFMFIYVFLSFCVPMPMKLPMCVTCCVQHNITILVYEVVLMIGEEDVSLREGDDANC